ncbi:hypothetical protein PAGU2595_018920 [Lysobacter xanthus]
MQAFVDGELVGEDAARIEAAMAADVLVAARVERERRLRATLRGAYDPVLAEPPPARLLDLLQRSAEADNDSRVVPMRPRPARARWRAPAIALAASVAAAALVGWWRMPGGDVATQGADLVARGTLDASLDTLLASTPDAGSRVAVGLTFRAVDGRVCRSFATRDTGLAGLACRDGDRWVLPVVSRQPTGTTEDLRQAASGLPPELGAAIEARMQGDAFDAAQERAAQAAGWR